MNRAKWYPLYIALLCVPALLAVTASFWLMTAMQRNAAMVSVLPLFWAQETGQAWDAALHRLDAAVQRAPDEALAALRGDLVDRRARLASAEQARTIHEQLRPVAAAATASPSATQRATVQQLAESSQDIEAQLLLIAMTAAAGHHEEAARQFAALWEAQLGAARLANGADAGSWQLRGYAWQPFTDEENPSGRLALFWEESAQPPQQAKVEFDPAAGTYRVGNRLIQLEITQNLLRNGNMEFGSAGRQQAIPLPWKLYPDQAGDTGDIVRAQYDPSRHATTLLMTGGRDDMLMTQLPLQPGVQYVVGLDVRAAGEGLAAVMENVAGQNQNPALIRFAGNGEWQRIGAPFQIHASPYLPGIYIGSLEDRPTELELDNVGIFAVTLPPGQ